MTNSTAPSPEERARLVDALEHTRDYLRGENYINSADNIVEALALIQSDGQRLEVMSGRIAALEELTRDLSDLVDPVSLDDLSRMLLGTVSARTKEGR